MPPPPSVRTPGHPDQKRETSSVCDVIPTVASDKSIIIGDCLERRKCKKPSPLPARSPRLERKTERVPLFGGVAAGGDDENLQPASLSPPQDQQKRIHYKMLAQQSSTGAVAGFGARIICTRIRAHVCGFGGYTPTSQKKIYTQVQYKRCLQEVPFL